MNDAGIILPHQPGQQPRVGYGVTRLETGCENSVRNVFPLRFQAFVLRRVGVTKYLAVARLLGQCLNFSCGASA